MIHLTVGGTNMRQYIYFVIIITLITLFAISYRIEYGNMKNKKQNREDGQLCNTN